MTRTLAQFASFAAYFLLQLNRASNPFQSHEQADSADGGSPEAQQDHAGIPQRAVVIQEGKVESVQPVVQPSFCAIEPIYLPDDLTDCGVHIDPRSIGIAKLDAHRRQWRLAVTRVVVRIVLGQERVFDDRRTR